MTEMSYGTNTWGMAMDCPDPWTATYTGIFYGWGLVLIGTLIWAVIKRACKK